MRHLGMEWMLMAHLWHGRVREVMLFRNAAAGTRDWRHCETAFSNVIVAGYKRNHPAVPWTPRTSGTEGGERWARISGLLPDGAPLSLEARRAGRLIAQCTFEVAYGPGDGGKE